MTYKGRVIKCYWSKNRHTVKCNRPEIRSKPTHIWPSAFQQISKAIHYIKDGLLDNDNGTLDIYIKKMNHNFISHHI